MSEKVDHEFVESRMWIGTCCYRYSDLSSCGLPRSAHPQPNAQHASPDYPLGIPGDVPTVASNTTNAQPAQPPAHEIEPGKLVRASDRDSADWWRAVEAINRPHQFEAGDYRCKVCGTPWRCHSDGTWSIRTSRLAERCCDNHPGFLLVMEKESE